MSDFLQAIADHLNAEPTMCACGHPSVLHTACVGCTVDLRPGVICPCQRCQACP